MQLIRPRGLFLVLSILACGPDMARESTWMHGTFSTRSANEKNVPAVLYYEFREDGTLVVSGIGDYGKTNIEAVEYEWRLIADDLVEVVLDEPYGATDRWQMSPGGDCNQLRIEDFNGDSELGGGYLYRGKVCLQDGGPCPSGSNCDANTAVYCDEPPPPCGDPST
jgi:hypothetical protein